MIGKVVVTWLCRNLPGEADEAHKTTQSRQSVSCPRFKPGTSRTQARSVALWRGAAVDRGEEVIKVRGSEEASQQDIAITSQHTDTQTICIMFQFTSGPDRPHGSSHRRVAGSSSCKGGTEGEQQRWRMMGWGMYSEQGEKTEAADKLFYRIFVPSSKLFPIRVQNEVFQTSWLRLGWVAVSITLQIDPLLRQIESPCRSRLSLGTSKRSFIEYSTGTVGFMHKGTFSWSRWRCRILVSSRLQGCFLWTLSFSVICRFSNYGLRTTCGPRRVYR